MGALKIKDFNIRHLYARLTVQTTLQGYKDFFLVGLKHEAIASLLYHLANLLTTKERDGMKIDILIDKLTPCLIENATGKIINTVFRLAQDNEVAELQKKGWNFDWSDKEYDDCNVYKLLLENDTEIQGLVAARVVKGAVFVVLAESAPHNRGKNKRYEGVGGHLFAIAIKLSNKNGFGGFIYFDTKNMDLVEHYRKILGAVVTGKIHDYRMMVEEEQAQKVIAEYTLEGDLE